MRDSDHPKARSERRYLGDQLTIRSLDQPVPIPAPLQSFSWPMELQGKGESNATDGSFEVRYPKGDVLLAFVTTIHELGHLRQNEMDPAIDSLPSGSHERLFAEERDAWERGWERVTRSCPDVIAALEAKVASARSAGKVEAVTSFRSLYEWVHGYVLTMVEAQRVLFDGAGSCTEERWTQLAEEFERIGLREFLEQYTAMRIGESVVPDEIEGMIRRVVSAVANE
ncbi:MAG: hypothetical protein Q8R16_02490 [bacterium]|nr:hypothetical protein [bacterium]